MEPRGYSYKATAKLSTGILTTIRKKNHKHHEHNKTHNNSQDSKKMWYISLSQENKSELGFSEKLHHTLGLTFIRFT